MDIINNYQLYHQYLEWFRKKWDALPCDKYHCIDFFEELLSMRKDPILQWDEKLQNDLKIITFDEYKYHYIKQLIDFAKNKNHNSLWV